MADNKVPTRLGRTRQLTRALFLGTRREISTIEKQHESNLVWGPIAIGCSIVFTVVAGMRHDPRFLFLVAWPCFAFGTWHLFKLIPYKALSRWITGISWALVGGVLWGLYLWLPPPAGASPTQSPQSAYSSGPNTSEGHFPTTQEIVVELLKHLRQQPAQKGGSPVTTPLPVTSTGAATPAVPPSPPNSTPSAALNLAFNQASYLDQQWQQRTQGAFLALGPGGGYFSHNGPSPEAKKAVASRLKFVDDDITANWKGVEPNIESAHALAIDCLRHPGKGQWTPSRVADDFGQFISAVNSAKRSLSFDELADNKTNQYRFKSLVDYLQSLQTQLQGNDQCKTP
jgi:hypothetical protein